MQGDEAYHHTAAQPKQPNPHRLRPSGPQHRPHQPNSGIIISTRKASNRALQRVPLYQTLRKPRDEGTKAMASTNGTGAITKAKPCAF